MNDRIRSECARDMENARQLGVALDRIFACLDPGMAHLPTLTRISDERADLIAANLPITPEGEAIVEDDQ